MDLVASQLEAVSSTPAPTCSGRSWLALQPEFRSLPAPES